MAWLSAFAEEAGVEFAAVEENVRRKAASGGYTFWDIDGAHVALASHAPIVGTGRHVIGRIGPVYTDPGYRRRGIGGAITAVIAQDLIDAGCTTVMLHTDADNPTSNGVYERIGFVRVEELEEWYVTEP
jgi:predicted GNAT family acetyltransferase